MTEEQRAKRNLNPHKAARVAMIMWGQEYSRYRGGSMDFWDSLSESSKQHCRATLKTIEEAPSEDTDKGKKS